MSLIVALIFCAFNSVFSQTTVINHTFDSGTDGWTIGSGWINDATSFTGNSTGHFHTTPFNDYPSNADFIVTSGTIDLSNYTALTLSTMIRYNTENSFDGVNIQYSTDGTNWTNLGAVGDGTNWYNDTNVNAILTGEPGWTGDNTNWETATIPLPAALEMTANIQFRFYFSSDGSLNDDGVAFDEQVRLFAIHQ